MRPDIYKLTALGASLCFSSLFAEKYYSYDLKKPNTLTLNENSVFVEKESAQVDISTSLSKATLLSNPVTEVNKIGKKYVKIKLNANHSKNYKKDLESLDGVKNVYPIYKNNEGIEMALTNRLVLKFNKGHENQIASIINKYSLKIISQRGLRYVLEVPKAGNALDISNFIMESGLVKYSHPDFYIEKLKNGYLPTDEYFNQQWHLHNQGQALNDGHFGNYDADIDAPEAWKITKGSSNIIVAVLDDGLSDNHPDLPNSRQIKVAGSNTADPSNPDNPIPLEATDSHGNACAGLVAGSQGNGQGISGVAPNVNIMPFNIFGATTNSQTADAITLAANSGADILTNSWGYGSSDPNLIPDIVDAVNEALTNGRGGLGCVVLFAAGNTANHVSGNSGFVNFPGSIPGVTTVGASDRYDLISNYSPKSTLIDIVAPSHRAYSDQIPGENFEIWSLDQPGNTGWNPQGGVFLPSAGVNFNSYTGRMGGTSAATPEVAGVAALVLSINPLLTAAQVENILYTTTDRIGPYTYTNGKSIETGHGRVNANNAVIAASNGVGSELNIALNKPVTASSEYDNLSFRAELAVDGKLGLTNKWNSSTASGNGPHWLIVDLGQSYLVNKYVLESESHSPNTYTTKNFQVQGSDNGTTWVTKSNIVGNTTVSLTKTVTPFSARYIRLYITDGGGGFARIHEFKVFGTVIKNVALNKTATASSEYTGNYQGYRAVDGMLGLSNKWNSSSAAGNGPHWLALDLGQKHSINRYVVESEEKWETKNFQIQTSNNGSTWTTVSNITNNKFQSVDKYLAPFSARYVRLYITGGDPGGVGFARIHEFELYGTSIPSFFQNDFEASENFTNLTRVTAPTTISGVQGKYVGKITIPSTTTAAKTISANQVGLTTSINGATTMKISASVGLGAVENGDIQFQIRVKYDNNVFVDGGWLSLSATSHTAYLDYSKSITVPSGATKISEVWLQYKQQTLNKPTQTGYVDNIIIE